MSKAWMGLTKQEDKCDVEDDVCRVKGWQWQDRSAYRFPDWHDWRGSFEPSNSGLCSYLHTKYERLVGETCGNNFYTICEKGRFEYCMFEYVNMKVTILLNFNNINIVICHEI